MDTENITIFDNDLEIAQALCSTISDSNIRNRAVANIVGAKIASRFFEEKYSVDSETGLHNIPSFLEKYDISDIYVENTYIDVRVYFNEDELCVPREHFDIGVLPAVYMFVKINTDLSGGVVTGFIKPENIDKNHLAQEYYHIREEELSSFYDIESSLTEVLDTFELPNELIYKYLEGSLDTTAQADVLKELVKSKSSRIKLSKIAMAQVVLNSVKLTDFAENSEDSAPSEDNLDDLYVPEVEVESEEEFLEALDYATDVTPSNASLIDEPVEDVVEETSESVQEQTEQAEQEGQEENIDALFTGEQEGVPVSKKKKSNGLLVLLLLIVLLAGGYFVYNNFTKSSDNLAQNQLPEMTEDIQQEVIEPAVQQPQEEAMPVETVETMPVANAAKEEAVAVAIPAIEKHLDASVLVSNLRVEWEIPSNYTNNASAKRYLYKLGKVIQLNLRSELLLLSKPPLSNKITVELKYNPNVGRFEYVGIKDSSGEKTVDSTIEDTVKNTLNMHMNSSTEAFDKLQGNPVLIIRL